MKIDNMYFNILYNYRQMDNIEVPRIYMVVLRLRSKTLMKHNYADINLYDNIDVKLVSFNQEKITQYYNAIEYSEDNEWIAVAKYLIHAKIGPEIEDSILNEPIITQHYWDH